MPKSPLQKRCPTIYRYNCPVTVTQNNPKSDEIDSNGIFHCFLSNTAANSTNEVLRFDSTFKLTELEIPGAENQRFIMFAQKSNAQFTQIR